MKEQDLINYNRIAKAIDYIEKNFRTQPDLDEIAENVHLSPYHFQRIFTEWAGTSPKKFLQYISLQNAKSLLKEGQATQFEAAYQTGLSGTGRLHDLFINVEGMTPREYKNGGSELTINYSFAESPFGRILAASTLKGLCYLSFSDPHIESLREVRETFPNARFQQNQDLIQKNALQIFQKDRTNLSQIKLHLKGTDFQLKVWEALLKIPFGNLSTYGKIAKLMDRPGASRAVGTAIAHNPVAFLIPCHRVIQSTGMIGNYIWGATRKKAIVGWEQAKTATI